MALPPGFTLEQPDVSPTTGLPEGFQLEQTNQVVAPQPTPAPVGPRKLGFDSGKMLADANVGMKKAESFANPVALGETALNFATGLGASAVGGLAGMAGAVLPGPEGQGAKWSQAVQQAGTYQPRTEGGKVVGGSVSDLMGAVQHVFTEGGKYVGKQYGAEDEGGLAGDVAPTIVGTLFGIKAPATRIATTRFEAPTNTIPAMVAGVRNVSQGLRNPAPGATAEVIAPLKAEAAAAASNADWQRAAKIDSAKVARSEDIILPPASVNEGKYGVRTAMAGGSDHFNVAASIANKTRWNNMARRELEIPHNAQLTAETYDAVRSRLAKPYDEAANLGVLKPDAKVNDAIRALDVSDILPAGEKTASNLKQISDHVIGKIENGMTGADAVSTTKALRANAKKVFDDVRNRIPVDASTLQSAKAQMAMAEQIDLLISKNIPDQTWKSSFDNARRKMAQSYALERATNLATRQIDPAVFAEEMMGRHQLTGAAKAMGDIAANYPEIANVYAKRGTTFSMPVRSGVTGTTGFAIGSLYGSPVATSAISATLGSIGETLYGNKLRGEKLQKKYATPVDRRIYEATTPPVQQALGMDGYVPPTAFRESPVNFSAPKSTAVPEGMQPKPTDYVQPRIAPTSGPTGLFTRINPEDAVNRIRFPNDAAKAEYVRATDLLRVAQEKEAALQAMSARNLSAAQRLQLRQSVESQREAVMIANEKVRKLDELYGTIEAEVSKGRPTTRSGMQGPKTRAFQRGMITGDTP